MKKFSLTALARDQLHRAKAENSGRSASTVFAGHEQVLRQTVVALRQGHALSEHHHLDEVTIYVLSGRICLNLNAGQTDWIGRTGDLLIAPNTAHSVSALEDSAILLTVAKKMSSTTPGNTT
ncbi:cupin domain-containing protein [Mycobacterium xenopi]|uniref:LuxR family transcriptional regulator n=1 Tax=Mycobacterium xenopi TaxID=1789 RepID=A0AAD1GZN3_MYCXE|nr:cupin domain-containing protein [Mycobacterium xenopi]MDA3638832.1 cupin domain-containing protein [Mycobacterium xenopi]MDA3657062.1 cupin domain-containing protein [Mycobacterium xenopi]MDA3662209.1 cupin domain-containing protein [Mycobacterium xenopi]ORX22073.1 LuxR family transcriptional regulator [Mycobacterium xenopi]SPX93515.1 cupin domain-containing protein [Mycobacterium xenopi]